MDKPPVGIENWQSPQGGFAKSLDLLSFLTFALGTFWTLTIRKHGTVGTRFYPTYVFFSMLAMAILLAGTQRSEGDQIAFHLAIPFLLINYAYHLIRTLRNRSKGNHVHSWHVGQSRFRGEGWELIIGLIVAGLAFQVAPAFGVFLCVSTICSALTMMIIQTRDKIRGNQMMDAQLEQERMLQIYERAKRGV